MLNQFSRTELIIGAEAIDKLNKSKVAIFGLGGVGSFVVEGLVRAGIENFVLIDDDKISLTNLNRQLFATRSTIGKYKVDVAKERILDINPNAKIEIHKEFFNSETEGILDKSINYIIDAIDTVTSKIELVLRAEKLNIPIISCMGTGNKLDATKFEVTDIYKTSVCPLAKVMRKELRARGVKKLKVVYSKEEPIKPKDIFKSNDENNCALSDFQNTYSNRKQVPGSISFVPSVAGFIVAGEIIKDLIKK